MRTCASLNVCAFNKYNSVGRVGKGFKDTGDIKLSFCHINIVLMGVGLWF